MAKLHFCLLMKGFDFLCMTGSAQGRKGVISKGVLTQELGPYHFGDMHQEPVCILKALDTDDLGHFAKRLFLLKHVPAPVLQLCPFCRLLLLEMACKSLA